MDLRERGWEDTDWMHLIMWIIVLLDKLIIIELVKKFPAFY